MGKKILIHLAGFSHPDKSYHDWNALIVFRYCNNPSDHGLQIFRGHHYLSRSVLALVRTVFLYSYRHVHANATISSGTPKNRTKYGQTNWFKQKCPWPQSWPPFSCRAVQSGMCRSALSNQALDERLSEGCTLYVREDELGMTSSMDKGARLNGSLVSESRCDLIVARSMMVLEDGNMTGSRISVNIKGSAGNTI